MLAAFSGPTSYHYPASETRGELHTRNACGAVQRDEWADYHQSISQRETDNYLLVH